MPLCVACHSKAHGHRMAGSELTRAGLQRARARGVLLGAALPQCRNLTEAGRARGRRAAGKAITERARAAYADVATTMHGWRAAGLSQQEIADRLNEQGRTTRRGRPWNQVQVMRVLGLAV